MKSIICSLRLALPSYRQYHPVYTVGNNVSLASLDSCSRSLEEFLVEVYIEYLSMPLEVPPIDHLELFI